MTRLKLARRVLATTILAVYLVATVSNASPPPTSRLKLLHAFIQKTYNVTISDFAFDPQNLTIRKGDAINWTNNDQVIHTLWFTRVADQSTYELSTPIPPSESWSHTFNETGVLQYYSFEHLWITGFITVTPLTHDIAVTNVVASPTEVTAGENVSISVMVENQGNVMETFNITAYYNSTTAWTAIETRVDVALSGGADTTLTLTWNTTDVPAGNYTIKANATQVLGETDTTDNTYADDTVLVKAPPPPPFPIEIIIAIAVVAIVIAVAVIYYYLRKRPKPT
ncbi:hypothetical protein GWO13_09825 [Candidatus Bathyarchaeota archaeon]|nr:hypothetical protein [Candidatus Bathyarchaeota archaeon]